MGIGEPFPGLKGQEPEVSHSPPSNADINHSAAMPQLLRTPSWSIT